MHRNITVVPCTEMYEVWRLSQEKFASSVVATRVCWTSFHYCVPHPSICSQFLTSDKCICDWRVAEIRECLEAVSMVFSLGEGAVGVGKGCQTRSATTSSLRVTSCPITAPGTVWKTNIYPILWVTRKILHSAAAVMSALYVNLLYEIWHWKVNKSDRRNSRGDEHLVRGSTPPSKKVLYQDVTYHAFQFYSSVKCLLHEIMMSQLRNNRVHL
jgi:hypothetical protein